MISYFNQEHPALSADLLARAVDELVARAIRLSQTFRIQFDYAGLEQAIGPQTLTAFLADLIRLPLVGPGELYEGVIDGAKAALLRRLLAFDAGAWSDLPLNHIQVVRLIGADGSTILRGNDTNDEILFHFPASEQRALFDSYRIYGLPEDVIEAVQVDLEGLNP